MIHFCENPMCRLHSVELTGPEFDVVKYREANGREVVARRCIIALIDAPDVTQTFAFCDTCAYVAAMINEPPKGPRAAVRHSPEGDSLSGEATPGGLLTAQPKS